MTKVALFSGQGSQEKGMGKDLFPQFPQLVREANEVLGYSIEELCLDNPDNRLVVTNFTQAAVFVVNSLHYLSVLRGGEAPPDAAAGHSLGEYCALFAAGAFDFRTGLTLVKKRGELMARAQGGGMLAVIGLKEPAIRSALDSSGLTQIDIANYNSPDQFVLSGLKVDTEQAKPVMEAAGARLCVALNVGGAFHSRYMREAKQDFARFLQEFNFAAPKFTVVSNLTAQPYTLDRCKYLLAEQMTGAVRWTDSIRYLLDAGMTDYREYAPLKVVTRLVEAIKKDHQVSPLKPPPAPVSAQPDPIIEKPAPVSAQPNPIIEKPAQQSNGRARSKLGSRAFVEKFGLEHAYLAGPMGRGVSSVEFVQRLAKRGMLGFLGTKSLSLDRVRKDVAALKTALGNARAFGVNVYHDISSNGGDDALLAELVRDGVSLIEASGFMSITASLVHYKACGITAAAQSSKNRIIAKVMRPEVAEPFLRPAPARFVQALLAQGKINEQQARALESMPMADALCVEGDSAGVTEQRQLSTLLPAILELRRRVAREFAAAATVDVGAAGGIGSPESAAAAFVLGADFIQTGSINQCTVEAATSDVVKDMLEKVNVQDTSYVPAVEMFEMGARSQVLKKGLLFPARANKLYDLYRFYPSFDQVDRDTRVHIEEKCLRRPFDDVFAELSKGWTDAQLQQAQSNPKLRMAHVFKWYLTNAETSALNGVEAERMDFQVYSGPALGAFNQWYGEGEGKGWRARHVDEIAIELLDATEALLARRLADFAK